MPCALCTKIHAWIAADCVEGLRRIQIARNSRKAKTSKPTAYSRHVTHVLATRRA